MKLAVKKDTSAENPLAGYHYMLMPVLMESDQMAALWALMGHTIIEVDEERGLRLLKAAGAALQHQVEVAYLTEKAIRDEASRPG